MTFYEIKDHLKIHGNLVEDNKADDHGGGAFFEDTGPIDIYCNTFQRNYSRDDGGAISFEDVGDDISIVNVHHNLFLQNIADDNGENSARGGALAFDDTFYARVHDNVIVGNMVAGSFTPAGGSIDSERNGHEYNGSDPLGRDIPPGFSDPKIYNNIIWGNMRLNFDQNHLGEEEDLGYQMGTNYVWSPDELHVDNPALQPPWESYNNSESFTDVWNNAISGAAYAANNIGTDPGFDIPLPIDWNSDGEFPLMQLTPIPGCNEVGFNFETNEFPGPETTTGTVILQPGTRETVYRVNAGGPELNGTPTWSEDTYHHRSPYYAKGSNYSASTRHGIDMSDPSIAGGTPEDLFQTQRRDSRRGDEMQWDFPVTPGTYEVRLYFAEIYRGAQRDGERIFDVSIEGNLVLDDYDVYADVGGYAGVVKSFVVSSDANLDIDFGHVKRDPAINGIEIIQTLPSLLQVETPLADQAAIPAAGLTVEEITPVVNAAVNRWLDSGLDLRSQQLLADVEITVSDLGGSTLLAATSGRMVKIDDNAAGYGWFVDSTPLDDVEFVVHNDRLEMQSSLSEPGGRMDLLTVLTHELGHVIGLEDHYTESEAGTIMHGFLGPNVRRVPSTMDASMLFSNSRELSRVLDAN